MPSEHDRRILQRFKTLMAERQVPLCQTILFGSRARGDARADSDYDVLVVVERLDPRVRRTISDCAWEAGFDEALVVVTVPVARLDFESGLFSQSLLAQAIRQEGVVV
ncbi:MAG: nucleotidyltransferase domain-containing protein [Candidatus Riflebacteria bacterium]|nr:nucleotidyltransferase domain-containing protein [Candidatus Riflebacteria bacterium]